MSDIYTKEGQRATATFKLCLTVEDLLALHDRAMELALLAEGEGDSTKVVG